MSFSFLSGGVPVTNTGFSANGFLLPSEVEPQLGTPTANGNILASNIDGKRYWTANVDLDNVSINTLSANGSIGQDGYVLTSNGSYVYWSENSGYTGSQGLQGPEGYVGSQGAQGVQGAPGAQGPIGYSGSQGLQGAQGVQGAQGASGYTGSLGYKGYKAYKELLALKVQPVMTAREDCKVSRVQLVHKAYKVRSAFKDL